MSVTDHPGPSQAPVSPPNAEPDMGEATTPDVPVVALKDGAVSVGIVGFTQTRDEAPWGDKTWELWGLNNLHQLLTPAQQCDRWFDLHDRQTMEAYDPADLAWLRDSCPVPLYVWDSVQVWLGAGVGFPQQPCLDTFGRYFTNSISWMMAMAMIALEPARKAGVEVTIGLYGVDMAQGTEYAAQRPSCEYMIGVARGLGYNVAIPEGSDLLKCATLYGVEDGGPLRAKLMARRAELESGIRDTEAAMNQFRGQHDQAQARVHGLKGALDNTNYFLGVWTMPEVNRDNP